MSQSLSKLYVHLVFSTKNWQHFINLEIESELHRYLSAVFNEYESPALEINSTMDHIHILYVQSKNITLARLVERIKTSSSKWIKTKGKQYSKFAWQSGYAGFSVSPSRLGSTIQYIKNQKEHHKRESFKEEVLRFLGKYGVEFNEKYLWD